MAPAPNEDATPDPGAAPKPGFEAIGAPDLTPIEPGAPMSRVAVEQKLTAAGLNLRRGRADDARRGVEEVLAAAPRYAPAHEIMGDVEAYLGHYAKACDSYRTALKIEPGRPSAELKLGRTALRATEAIGGFQTLQETSSAPLARAGNGVAGFASAVLPGLGQIMKGAYLKGAIMMGVYCLVNLLILLLPDTKDLLGDIGGMLSPRHGAGGGSGQIGGMFWFLAFISTIDWLYAVIDAGRGND